MEISNTFLYSQINKIGKSILKCMVISSRIEVGIIII